MSFSIILSHETKKILLRMDVKLRERFQCRFLQLAEDPFDPRLSSPLTERAGVRKSRVGGWRVLFTVNRDTKVLYVATVDTRGQVYKHS